MARSCAVVPIEIVDAHHHLWDLSAINYPWLQVRGVRRFFGDPAAIQKDYLLSDFRRDIGTLPVRASVHVQVGVGEADAVAETRWLQQQADADLGGNMPNAIVAFTNLAAPDFPAQIALHQQYRNLRGVRQIVGRHASEDSGSGGSRLLDNTQWRQNLGRLEALDLSFDLQLVPTQLEAACDVFSLYPGLKVALCHAGSPGAEPDQFSRWRRGVQRWAALPNAFCKFSGFGMFDPRWNAASVRRHFEVVLEAFGADRVMLGSNFPVEKLVSSYAAVWHAYAELCAPLGEKIGAALHAGNARRFYRT